MHQWLYCLWNKALEAFLVHLYGGTSALGYTKKSVLLYVDSGFFSVISIICKELTINGQQLR